MNVFSVPFGFATTISRLAFKQEQSLVRSAVDGIIAGGIWEAGAEITQMLVYNPGKISNLLPSVNLKALVPAAAITGACANAYLIKQITKHNDLEYLKKLCNGEIPRDSKSNFIYTIGAYFPVAALSFFTSWSYIPLAVGTAFCVLAKVRFNAEAKGGLVNKFDSDTIGYLSLGAATLLAYASTPLTSLASNFSTEGMFITAALSAATAWMLKSKVTNLRESCADFVTVLEANQQTAKNDMNDPNTVANLEEALGPKKSNIFRHLNTAIKPEIMSISDGFTKRVAGYFLLLKILNKAGIAPDDYAYIGATPQDIGIIDGLRTLMTKTPTITNSVQINKFCTDLNAANGTAIDPNYMEKLLKYISKRVNEESKQISI